ncbi:uncharacterized protein [Eurosta solidaginis]|uniref:uncharacterized protein isoform X2 n=1 Tax=Eurosta solidaginis TaxID=178769 RepID=UPI0035312B70
MKFLDYGEEFLFDDMPKLYNLLTDANFVYLDPTKNPHALRLNDEKRIKVYIFEEASAARNIMVLLQKDGKITHFYAGACVFMREIILNDTFVACVAMGVEKLYMDLRRSKSPCNPNELNDIIDEIDRLLHKNQKLIKIQLIVELFAHEELVAELGNRLRGLVHLNDKLLSFHGHFLCLEHFQMDVEKARIFIEQEPNTEEYKNRLALNSRCHDSHVLITMKLTNETSIKDKTNNYFELHYSTLPSSFNLKVLASVVCPSHIYGITYRNNMMPPSLPEYLRPFCSIPGKVRLPKKSKTRPSSGKPLPKEKISPNKDTPAPYCIHKTNFEYVDDEDSQSSD